MTPAALILLGFVSYFMFRFRFVALSLIYSWRLNMENRERDRKRAARRVRNDVGFYTVEQVWGDEDKEKRSA